MVQSHESFTHPFAGSGLQVHGTDGSIFADGVMTQRPVGTVTLVTAAGRQDVPFAGHDLYTQGVAEFVAACRGQGRPAATGLDGVRSLAVAMAVRQAAQTGQRVTVAA
jgi:1,5-anhydro-D-fructose reductase (1,5-anhydro-D-mannitol-forming)